MASSELAWNRGPARLPLADDQVHVWAAVLDRPADELRDLAHVLSADERERAGNFHFRRDRDRFIVCRATLRLILSGYIAADPVALVFRQGAAGKPALQADPATSLAAPALEFNVSHSEGLALYAVTHGRRVGVDIEHVRPLNDAERIAERFFSPAERAALAALAPATRLQAFFACWTRKEAYLKATGDGLTRPLDQFDVSLAPDTPAALLRVEGGAEEMRRWRLQALTPAPGYVGALAVEGSDWHLVCLQAPQLPYERIRGTH